MSPLSPRIRSRWRSRLRRRPRTPCGGGCCGRRRVPAGCPRLPSPSAAGAAARRPPCRRPPGPWRRTCRHFPNHAVPCAVSGPKAASAAAPGCRAACRKSTGMTSGHSDSRKGQLSFAPSATAAGLRSGLRSSQCSASASAAASGSPRPAPGGARSIGSRHVPFGVDQRHDAARRLAPASVRGPGPGHRRRASRPDRDLRLPAWPGRPLRVRRQGQPENLLKEIRGRFGSQSPRPVDFATRSPQPEHGRIERREIRTSTDPVTGIAFPWVEQVFMIKRTARECRCARNGMSAKPGRRSVEIVYGITSHTPETAGAEALPAFSRAHCSCENRVHRILDDQATWNEDRCRVRTGHGPENPAVSGDWRPVPSSGAASRSRRRSGTGPEPAPRARPAQARPEHAATPVRRAATQPATPDQAKEPAWQRQAGRSACPQSRTGGKAGARSRNCRRNCRTGCRMNCQVAKSSRQGSRRKNQPWPAAASRESRSVRIRIVARASAPGRRGEGAG